MVEIFSTMMIEFKIFNITYNYNSSFKNIFIIYAINSKYQFKVPNFNYKI